VEKADYRSLSSEERLASRKAAIRMIKRGIKKKDVAEAFGVPANTVTKDRSILFALLFP